MTSRRGWSRKKRENTTRESQSLTSEEEEDNQENMEKNDLVSKRCTDRRNCALFCKLPPLAAEVFFFFTCMPQNTVGLQLFLYTLSCTQSGTVRQESSKEAECKRNIWRPSC